MKKLLIPLLIIPLLLSCALSEGRIAALLTDDARGHAVGAALAGLSERDGVDLVLSYAPDADAQLVQFAEVSGVGAMIVMPLCAPEVDVPTVALEGSLDGAACRVDFDPDATARLLADELLSLTGGAPINVEFAAGEAGKDVVYEKALELIRPALDDGRLACPSGKTTFEDVSTGAEIADETSARVEQLVYENYGDKTLDAVLCSDPSAARGALEGVVFGYGGEGLPAIIAAGCEKSSVTNIIDGLQRMCAFPDPRITAEAAWGAAIDMMDFRPVGAEILCAPARMDAENVRELAYSSGLYEEDEYGYPVEDAPEEEDFGTADAEEMDALLAMLLGEEMA